jgi:hypothetical protein
MSHETTVFETLFAAQLWSIFTTEFKSYNATIVKPYDPAILFSLVSTKCSP